MYIGPAQDLGPVDGRQEVMEDVPEFFTKLPPCRIFAVVWTEGCARELVDRNLVIDEAHRPAAANKHTHHS